MLTSNLIFGMAQTGRNWDGIGKSLDYGARWYDPRKARWDAVDPLANVFPSQSPYSYAYNSPLIYIDEGGKYPYWLHFKMTYLALVQNGCDVETAKEIAHYASVFADHPPKGGSIEQFNLLAANFDNIGRDEKIPYLLMYMNDENNKAPETGIPYGDLENSQSTSQLCGAVVIHGMMAGHEDISPEDAMNRSLYGGSVTELDGSTCEINGAVNDVFEILGNNSNFAKLSRTEKIKLGIAFHTIQDNVVHKGSKWADESFILSLFSAPYRNLIGKPACDSCNGHPDTNCTLGTDSEKAQNLTNTIIESAIPGSKQTISE